MKKRFTLGLVKIKCTTVSNFDKCTEGILDKELPMVIEEFNEFHFATRTTSKRNFNTIMAFCLSREGTRKQEILYDKKGIKEKLIDMKNLLKEKLVSVEEKMERK